MKEKRRAAQRRLSAGLLAYKSSLEIYLGSVLLFSFYRPITSSLDPRSDMETHTEFEARRRDLERRVNEIAQIVPTDDKTVSWIRDEMYFKSPENMDTVFWQRIG